MKRYTKQKAFDLANEVSDLQTDHETLINAILSIRQQVEDSKGHIGNRLNSIGIIINIDAVAKITGGLKNDY